MVKRGALLLAGIIIFFIFASSLTSAASCYCDSCADCTSKLNNSSCTEVKLTANIINFVGTCIDNPAGFNNKVFDCQGYKIDGDDLRYNYGIYLNGKQNNTIKNCVITDFYVGIYLWFSWENTLTNNTASSNNFGIYLYYSSDNEITNANVRENEEIGIVLSSTNNTKIKNCIIKGNPCDKCIFVKGSGARHNYITKTEIHSCATGILIYDYGIGSYASLTVNQSYIHDNTDQGIRIYGGNEMGLVLIDSVITANGKGVYLDHRWGAHKDPKGFLYNSTICNNTLDLQIDTKDNYDKDCAGSYAKTIGGTNANCPNLNNFCPTFPSSGCVWQGVCSRYVPAKGASSTFEFPNINFCPAIPDECKNQSPDHIVCRNNEAYNCQGCGGWYRDVSLDYICKPNYCLGNYSTGWVKYRNHENCTSINDFYSGCVIDITGDGIYDKLCCPVYDSLNYNIALFEPTSDMYSFCRSVK
ncbi:MAG: right-handed parallel beta-helix repeat-containing protein [Candidatus Pacearchaeota archaeon]